LSSLISKIRAKIRLDFKGVEKPGRLLFGGQSAEKTAEELREKQVAIFRNVPIQGITIEDIDMSMEIYTVYDDIDNIELAFAPVILSVTATAPEDLIGFIVRDDFRKIEILEPDNLQFTKNEMERFLFKVSEEIRLNREQLRRKYSHR